MTPAARVQAAIECLDEIFGGRPAEQVLTGWARRSRFAGSKDRAAVRDHVYDALRRRRSAAALGGAETGRGVMLGLIRQSGLEVDELFSGQGHAPLPLSEQERAGGREPEPGAEALDLPDWLWERFVAGLGQRAEAEAKALRHRAPVHLRVNLVKGDVASAQAALLAEGIETQPHPASPTALEVTGGANRLRGCAAYNDGLVELQDSASQAVVDLLPLRSGMRVLDYCAGGGGKTLAIAGRAPVKLFAHDAAPERLRDLEARAKRAGAKVELIATEALSKAAPFDLILCDVPCSGSGSWRRDPDGKWNLTPERLERTRAIQAGILDKAAALIAPGGVLAYATCSLLDDENSAQVQAFVARNSGWTCGVQKSWGAQAGTDGFFTAHLTRA